MSHNPNAQVLADLGLDVDPTVYAAQKVDLAQIAKPELPKPKPQPAAENPSDVTIPGELLDTLTVRSDWRARDAVRDQVWAAHRKGRGSPFNKALWRHLNAIIDEHFDQLEASTKAKSGVIRDIAVKDRDGRVDHDALAQLLAGLDDAALATLGVVRS